MPNQKNGTKWGIKKSIFLAKNTAKKSRLNRAKKYFPQHEKIPSLRNFIVVC